MAAVIMVEVHMADMVAIRHHWIQFSINNSFNLNSYIYHQNLYNQNSSPSFFPVQFVYIPRSSQLKFFCSIFAVTHSSNNDTRYNYKCSKYKSTNYKSINTQTWSPDLVQFYNPIRSFSLLAIYIYIIYIFLKTFLHTKKSPTHHSSSLAFIMINLKGHHNTNKGNEMEKLVRL